MERTNARHPRSGRMTDYQPPRLRDILNRGEDLAIYVLIHIFAEEVLYSARSRAPRAYRQNLLRLIEMERYSIPGHTPNPKRDRQITAEHAWALEVFDNPDLLPRVRAALPPVEVA